MNSRNDWLVPPNLEQLEAFHDRKLRALDVSNDGRLGLRFSAKTRPAIWLTRKDLHAWVWSVPFHRIKELFVCEHIGWICAIYRVSRPGNGGWQNSRSGKPKNVIPLDESFPAEFPVPIFEFSNSYRGLGIAALFNGFAPAAQIGPPQETAQHPLLPNHISTIPLPDTRVKLHTVLDDELEPIRAVLGPFGRITRGKLQQLIQAGATDELSLYGLNWRQVMVISEQDGLRPPDPKLIDRPRAWERKSFSSNRSKKFPSSAADRTKLIDLSAARLKSIGQIIAERDRIDDAEAEKSKRKREEARKNAEQANVENAREFLRLRVEGQSLGDIARQISPTVGSLQTFLRDCLMKKYPDLQAWRLRELLERLFFGRPTDADILVVHWALPDHTQSNNVADYKVARGYSGSAPYDANARLAEWISSARQIEVAQSEMDTLILPFEIPNCTAENPIVFRKELLR